MALPVRVKICGITRREDALFAARRGADYLGLIFSQSPRRVTLKQGQAILDGFPPSAAWVGVFRDEPLEEVIKIARTLNLSWVQLHGREDPDYLRALSGEFLVIKAFEVGEAGFVQTIESYTMEWVLLDSPKESNRGWDFQKAVRIAARKKVFLSGGLGPESVGAVVQMVRPYAVDVSRGVESAPGVKDPGKIEAFIRAVKEVDFSDES